MRYVDSCVDFVTVHDPGHAVKKWIEKIGRVCYKSEDKITDNSCDKFFNMLLKNKHLSVLEHLFITGKLTCSRGCSHELVRHRLASYTQESTRYCNYAKGKFNNEITCISLDSFAPSLLKENKDTFTRAFTSAESYYFELLKQGVRLDLARQVLPIGLKTEIVISSNLREWLHIFELRTSNKAHVEIRKLVKIIAFNVWNEINNNHE